MSDQTTWKCKSDPYPEIQLDYTVKLTANQYAELLRLALTHHGLSLGCQHALGNPVRSTAMEPRVIGDTA